MQGQRGRSRRIGRAENQAATTRRAGDVKEGGSEALGEVNDRVKSESGQVRSVRPIVMLGEVENGREDDYGGW